MSWIEKPWEERIRDVDALFDRIEQESPDRFWQSTMQEGQDTQEMLILLPGGKDIYYRVHIVTAQLKALRLLAPATGYDEQNPVLTDDILYRVDVVSEEQFEIDNGWDDGIHFDVVIDAPGLTTKLIDDLLLKFLASGGVPPLPKSINAPTLTKRLVHASENGYLNRFSLIPAGT